MIKCTLHITSNSRFYSFFKKLFANLVGIEAYDETDDTMIAYMSDEACDIINSIMKYSCINVPMEKTHVSDVSLVLVPIEATLFVLNDKDIYCRLRHKYPARNIKLVDEEEASSLISNYNANEKLPAYIVYSNGSCRCISA